MQIRPAVLADVDTAVALSDRLVPFLLTNAGQLRHDLARSEQEPGRRRFAAVDGTEVVGWATTALLAGSDPLSGQLRVLVDPAYRGRGIGAELLELCHGGLKTADATSARVFADPAAVTWAARWGYRQTREVHYAGMDPRSAPPLPPVPAGLRLATFDELEPRQVYEADLVAQRTKPGDARITTRPYDEWLTALWQDPGTLLDLSTALLDGDRVAAFTLATGDHHRVWSQMTATMPDQRGRGLAQLVKCAMLHRAAAAGVTGVHTANYDGNAPMLAVNDRLGYRRTATHSVLIGAL